MRPTHRRLLQSPSEFIAVIFGEFIDVIFGGGIATTGVRIFIIFLENDFHDGIDKEYDNTSGIYRH